MCAFRRALRRTNRTLPITATLLLASFPLALAQSTTPDFERDIEPIFHQKCYVCHGSAQKMNGLRLDDKEAALKGGYSGPAVVAGDSASSKLLERVSSTKEGFKMPPAGPGLSQADVEALRTELAARPDCAVGKPVGSRMPLGQMIWSRSIVLFSRLSNWRYHWVSRIGMLGNSIPCIDDMPRLPWS